MFLQATAEIVEGADGGLSRGDRKPVKEHGKFATNDSGIYSAYPFIVNAPAFRLENKTFLQIKVIPFAFMTHGKNQPQPPV